MNRATWLTCSGFVLAALSLPAVKADDEAPGSIVGSLVFPEGVERKAFDYRLQIALYIEPKAKPSSVTLQAIQVVSVDANGQFRFDELAPGRYVIGPAADQNAPWFTEPTEPLDLKSGQNLSEVTIPLKKANHLQGRVADGSTGKGIEFVELDAYVLSGGNDVSPRGKCQVVTDAEGRFTAWLRPGKVWLRVREVPAQYVLPPIGRPDYRELPDGEWPTIELTRAAVLTGLVVDDAGAPAPLARLDISVDRSRRAPTSMPQNADRSGKFTIGGLEAGQSLKLRARTADAATDGATLLTLRELGGSVTLVVSPQHSCRVSGQIVDEQDNPVPQARVSVTARRRQDLAGGTSTFPETVADVPAVGQDGQFHSEALWVGDSYFLRVEADGFSPLTTDLIATDENKVYDFGPLVLHRTIMVRGQVVDDAGQPLPNADLRIHIRSLSRTGGSASKTDGLGQFGFDANHDAVVSVWARCGSAVSNGAETKIASLLGGATTTIAVSEAFAFRFTGKVVDRRGQAVEDAVVHVVWIDDTQRSGGQPMTVLRQGTVTKSQFHVSECSVSADGTFVTEALWPDLHYNVVALAEGCQAWESATLVGEAGQTQDLGEITLKRGRLSVAGRVVDMNDKPLPGAAIINSGDADRPLRTETAADGTFQLDGMPDGPVFLLVRKAGYWPTGARREAGDSSFDIVMLDESIPRAGSNRAPASSASERERQAVREELNQLWKLRDRFETSVGQRGRRAPGKAQLIECMAAIDLEQALRWSAAENGNYDDEARLAAAKRVVDENVDEALLLADVPNDIAEYTLRSMASRRLAAGAKDDALRLLRAELSPGQARRRLVTWPYRDVARKAEIGRMAMQAGADDWGRRLIVEAADEIEKHLDDEQSFQWRSSVAEALAAVDPPRAMRIWRSMPIERPGYIESYNSRIAGALAAEDLSDARKILEAVETSYRGHQRGFSGLPEQVRTAIAYGLARTDIDAALALLDEKPFATAIGKAEALSWLAVAVAKRDKRRAWQLIDRAFDVCLDDSESGNTGFDGGRPFNAARIAIKAQKIGYPDMRSVVDRVLATRATLRESSSAVTLAESTLMVARLLALIEPKLARELLVSIEPQAASIGTGKGRIKRGDRLVAWALVDLDRARKLFADELGIQQRQPTPELSDSGLIPMLEVLVLPPDERAAYLERDLAYTFVYQSYD